MGTWVLSIAANPAPNEKGTEFFENSIRPLLIEHCYECHSEESGKQKGGLLLDRREGWQLGGDTGAALIPGDLENSLLVHAVRGLDPDTQMPPKDRLSPEDIALLERWISIGAPDPRDTALVSSSRKDEAIDYETARTYWAFLPAKEAPPPATTTPNWPYQPLDHFILAALQSQGLEPAPDAPPRELLRRLHYDLTGLPPTPKEVSDFVGVALRSSQSEERAGSKSFQEHYQAVVDDLLARPAFGEKWGRHWLDVARYADSNGGDRNFTFYQAWRYRNYVVDAFNKDKLYYDFVREQLAGDLLPWDNDEQRHDQLVGSTFLALGPKMLTERDKEKLRLDVADEQVDTLGRAFLGLTFGCARCHDHKFDPVSQADYYALAGIMRSTQIISGTRNGCVNVASWVEQPLPLFDPKECSELEAKVARLELVMRLAVEKLYMDKAGGKMTLDDLPLAGVLYDESDAELLGDWTESTLSDNRFGEKYIHDDKKAKGTKSAVFRASLPENGLYEVRLAYNAANNRAVAVPIRIEALGVIHEVTLDETKKPSIGGLFEPVGRFRFEKGARATVIIETTGTAGYVIVDGVQFIAVPDIAREAEAIAAAAADMVNPLFRMSNNDLKKELSKMINEMRDESLAMAPRDAADAADIHLRVRGETDQLGPLVSRRFPLALHDGPAPEIAPGSSGRLELAEWITSRENTLLDRVIVNRLWHHLFGRGIVGTVDNFGELGDRPTHPELLDHLAAHFRARGGSLKETIRELVTSRTYQLSASAPESLLAGDPENELFGRHARRRLTAEEIRDSLLYLAGRLERTQPEATSSTYGEDLDNPIDLASATIRTVYLPVARNNLAAELELFDAPNPDLVTGARPTTSVPTQSLYLLNNEFVAAQAREIGVATAAIAAGSPLAAADHLYITILHRHPSEHDARRAAEFLIDLSGGADAESEEALSDACTELAHILLASAEFLFLD